MNKIIDVHSHYTHKRFSSGRNALLSSLGDNGIVAVVDAAIGFDSNSEMLEHCNEWPSLFYAVVGCHPNRIREMNEENFSKIADLLSHPNVIGIGETGLDYSSNVVFPKTEEDIELQKKWFLRFVELALKHKKPLVIHCRETEAYDDLIDMLSTFHLPEIPGIIHCFGSNTSHFEKLASLGFYFSIGGMFTKLPSDHKLLDALRAMPLERILLETDCPFLAPAGTTGNRNSSLNIPHIVDALATLRDENPDDIYTAAYENTKKVFPGIVGD